MANKESIDVDFAIIVFYFVFVILIFLFLLASAESIVSHRYFFPKESFVQAQSNCICDVALMQSLSESSSLEYHNEKLNEKTL